MSNTWIGSTSFGLQYFRTINCSADRQSVWEKPHISRIVNHGQVIIKRIAFILTTYVLKLVYWFVLDLVDFAWFYLIDFVWLVLLDSYFFINFLTVSSVTFVDHEPF